jgi:hypothetical protein
MAMQLDSHSKKQDTGEFVVTNLLTLTKLLICGTGGADRNRTCDLLIANETLCQLSYDPNRLVPRPEHGHASGWLSNRVYYAAFSGPGKLFDGLKEAEACAAGFPPQ